MFEEYKTALLHFYLSKKAAFQLSAYMESPNRERIRKECVVVFLKKNSRKDKEFIRSFFDPTARYDDQVRSIERYNLDKLRPLVSFLTNGTNIRDEGSIKLLAWLIDFPNYEDWRVNPVPLEVVTDGKSSWSKEDDIENNISNEKDELNIILPDTGIEDIMHVHQSSNEANIDEIEVKNRVNADSIRTEEISPVKPKSQLTILVIVTISALMILFGVGAFRYLQDKSDRETISNDEKCMYWNGDRYEAIACEKQINGIKLPLNRNKLNSLRKITAFDTLTENDLGKVWYAKIKNQNEYFTAGGMHPVDTTKRLKPLTPYILNKYISYHRYLLQTIGLSFGIGSLGIMIFYFVNRYLKNKRRNKLTS